MSNEIQDLCDQGRTKEAIDQIDQLLSQCSDEEAQELQAIKAWCHYRRQEYVECCEAIELAGGNVTGGNVKARECLAQVAAFVDKDDALLRQISSEFTGNIVVANAFVVRARDKDSDFNHDRVMELVNLFLDSTEIAATNLVNNAGRFFYAKKRNSADLFTALGLLESAFIRYEEGKKNLHHRAAVLFWQSKIIEDLFGKEAARMPARGSFYLWERQVELDPTNQAFQNGLENAWKRLVDLGCDPDSLL